jgi:uncharacterized RDD family membrane protein YckC
MNDLNATTSNLSATPLTEEYPSLRRRFLGITIDSLVIITVFIISGQLFDLIGDVSGYIRGFIFIFMFFLYDPAMVSFSGGTLGHRLMRMKVTDIDTGRNLPIYKAIIRFVVKALLGWISFLAVSFNPSKRAIHDIASNAIMVNR